MKFGKFGVLGSSLAVSALLAGSTAMFADAIPYPTPGVIYAGTPIISNGTSLLFYYNFSAADLDYVNIYDTTRGTQSGQIFPNQTAGIGTQVALTTGVGDNLVVELIDRTTGKFYYSGIGVTASTPTTAMNGGKFLCAGSTTLFCAPDADSDNVNHAYMTAYTGGVIPGSTVNPGPGLFIGLEDRDMSQNSDFDYNDDQFVLTGVGTTVTPEPGSIALLGTGILGAAGMIRRRLQAAK